eukprot:1985181-Rhodomonas_salina.1
MSASASSCSPRVPARKARVFGCEDARLRDGTCRCDSSCGRVLLSMQESERASDRHTDTQPGRAGEREQATDT